jgi:membrane protein implicated in regulation of membrane protease activity
MNRTQTLGISFLLVGILIPLGFAVYAFIVSDLPLMIKLSATFIFIGFSIILLSLVRERLEDIKKERKR